MNDQSTTPDLLTAEEVARRLRVRPATVYAAAADGRLPAVRFWRGRRKSLVRFLAKDVEQWIHDRRVLPKGGAR